MFHLGECRYANRAQYCAAYEVSAGLETHEILRSVTKRIIREPLSQGTPGVSFLAAQEQYRCWQSGIPAKDFSSHSGSSFSAPSLSLTERIYRSRASRSARNTGW